MNQSSNYIHETAVIYPGVFLGRNVYIGPLCIIGAPPEWRGKEDTASGTTVVIGDNVRITGLVTIDAGANGGMTIIMDGSYLMKHSHIGHNAVVGRRNTISCGAKVGGNSELGDDVNLGLNAVIHQNIIIPDGVMIGASSFVGKNSVLRPGYKYAGVPVRELGENRRPQEFRIY